MVTDLSPHLANGDGCGSPPRHAVLCLFTSLHATHVQVLLNKQQGFQQWTMARDLSKANTTAAI